MDSNDVIIRRERPEDFRTVENLVREAFWNVYRPGCKEHYVLHRLRDDPAFVPELDLVMEKDGQIMGQNMFMRAVILADDGREVPIVTMGPICIAPEYKRQGYGKRLLDRSLELAADLGCGALCFEGNIHFYGKSGFTCAPGVRPALPGPAGGGGRFLLPVPGTDRGLSPRRHRGIRTAGGVLRCGPGAGGIPAL